MVAEPVFFSSNLYFDSIIVSCPVKFGEKKRGQVLKNHFLSLNPFENTYMSRPDSIHPPLLFTARSVKSLDLSLAVREIVAGFHAMKQNAVFDPIAISPFCVN
jgi:NADPH-dependent curcumin reductase CurA